MKNKNTMIELVQELGQLPQHPEIKMMIKEAIAGEYHDFKNNKYVCGKMASAEILAIVIKKYPDCAEGATNIRNEITTGVYDEPADEADKEMMRADLETDGKTPMSEALKKMLGLDE